MFTPIRTERLLIRAMKPEDAEALWRRRSDPRVAEYQNWATPYTRETAEQLVAAVMAEGDPRKGEWLYTVADPETDESIGDLFAEFTWQGRSVEIGYTFHPDHWGKGYAVESVAALVEYLFEELGVTRISGSLHPDNRASAQVLERVGMLHEGHTRQAYWAGDEVSDDWIYGMTREDWEAWRDRPRKRPGEVRLAEITGDDYGTVVALRTHKTQESFVAPVLKSLAQALLAPTHSEYPTTPWYRAIEADGELVGFVMVALDTPREPEPFLWRLLIDRLHQRRGIASLALELVEREMKAMGHGAWKTSWVPGRGSPESFYLKQGFEPTGEIHGGEVVASKAL